jgi:hypothetical protein
MRGSTQKKEEEMGRRVWLKISDVLGTQFGTFFSKDLPIQFLVARQYISAASA